MVGRLAISLPARRRTVSSSVGDWEIIHERPFDEDAPGGEFAWGLGVLGQGKGAAAWVWDLEARRLDRPL